MSFIKKLEGLDPYVKEAMISLAEEIETRVSIRRSEFNELKDIVKELFLIHKETKNELKELTWAQKRTEVNIGEMARVQQKTEGRMEELAEAQKELVLAQKRTEGKVEELAEAQKRTEGKVEELAEAQKRTEGKVEELAEAQKRTEGKVEELAEAQKETKIEIKELTQAQEQTTIKVGQLAEAQRQTELEILTLTETVKGVKKQLGGLSMHLGYGVEDKIFPYIFDIGKKEFAIEVALADRRNIIYPDGKYDEVNIYAEGLKDSRPSILVGECKAQPGKKDFDKFSNMTERIQKVIKGDIYPFMVGYHLNPEVEVYAHEKYPHIRIFKTFEFELKYKKKSA